MKAINTTIAENIEAVFEHFDYYPIKKANRYDGPCPIHEGDKYNAFNLYHSGHTCIGNWRCNTQGCHYVFDNDAIGLIRGLLSKQNGWKGFGDKNIVSRHNAVEFYKETFGLNIDYKETTSSQKFSPNIKNKYKELNLLGNIEELYGKLSSPYHFMNRGFSKEILSKNFVGRCETFGKPMYMREVVPILDISGKSLIGVTGRSINDECKRCGCHHFKNKPCPPTDKQGAYSKWKHSNTNLTHVLYNIWNAKHEWQKKYSAILVESPPATWRFEEAGILGSVSTFGAHLTYEQSLLLDEYKIKDLYLVFDNDSAGEAAREQARYIADGRYTIHDIRLPKRFNDPVDMETSELQQFWSSIN